MKSLFLFTLLLLFAGAFSQNSVAATGGPDAFGYSFTDSSEPDGPVYNFEDISTTGAVSTVSTEDDAAETVNLGFTFSHYGSDFTAVSICSNGFLQFGGSDTTYPGQPIPLASVPNNMIAGWWNDLGPHVAGTIHYQTLGIAPNRRFIVQFQAVADLGNQANLNTFQFKLFEGSHRIEIHYQAITTSGNNNSIGIENADGTVGLQYYHGTSLPAIGGGPFAVRFFAPPPTRLVTNANDSGTGSLRQAILDADSGDAIIFAQALNGQTITLTTGELAITKSLVISASLDRAITLSGNNASRHFNVPFGPTLELDGLILTGGNSASDGGSILNSGSLFISNCRLQGNTATSSSGGALRNFNGGTAVIRDSVLSGNIASGFGNGGAISNSSSLVIERSTLSGNDGREGGGINNNGSNANATLKNVTVSGNISLAGGGGITNDFNASLTLIHTTISGNNTTSNPGGGISMSSGTVAIENSIVAGNTAGGGVPDFRKTGGTITATGKNLIGRNDSVTTEFPAGPLVGTSASPLAPMLAALGNYGGPTQTMPPLAGSPAIDPSGGATSSSLATDQRGFPRVLDGNDPPDGTATVDVGAVEYRVPVFAIVVANNNPSGPGSLPQAIADIDAPGIITFAPALSGSTINLTGDELIIDKSMTLDASELAAGLTIHGNGLSRVLSLEPGTTATLNSLTITGGSGGIGGGISSSGTLTLLNSTIHGNSGFGGGIFHSSNAGMLTVTNCTFTNNSGGAIYLHSGTATIRNSTISGNAEAGMGLGSGGGILVEFGNLVLENTIVAGNTAALNADISKLNESTVTNGGGNLIGDNSSVATAFPVGPLVGTTASPRDPKLAPLAANGGPASTMRLKSGSPAVDAGVSLAGTPATDQRGVARFGSPDIGAFEQTRSVVDTVADDGDGSLREALGSSNIGHVIGFDPGIFNGTPGAVIVVSTPLSVVGKIFEIDASNLAYSVTVSGGGSSRVLTIDAASEVEIDGLTITDGASTMGGGISSNGLLTLRNTTVSDNTANNGGGIFNSGTLTLDRSTVSGNTASPGNGGGILNHGTLTVTNSTFFGNSAPAAGDGLGGGIHNNVGNLTITHSTFTGNHAGGFGGGFYALGGSAPILNHSIVAGNSAGILVHANLSGTEPTGANNLTSGDPLLAPLANYGGATQTMPPLPSSPAINAAGASSLTTDQRGAPRPVGAASDIGAVEALILNTAPALNATLGSPRPVFNGTGAPGANYEIFLGTQSGNLVSQGFHTLPYSHPSLLAYETTYFWRIDTTINGQVFTGGETSYTTRQMNFVVTTLDDDDNGLVTGGISLREAINGAVDGETITFAPALNGGTITLGGSGLTIDDDITIDGSTLAAGITVSGGNLSRVFHIAPATVVTLDTLTITAGNDRGIYNQGSLTLERSTVSGNTAGGGNGGGIYIPAGGTLTANHCTLTGNSGFVGGGIMSEGTTALSQTTISGNTASHGGGLWRGGGSLSIHNTIIAGNTAPGSFPDFANPQLASGVNLIGVAPVLAPLGYYGGPTKTMPPLFGSPAINAGGATDLLTDQRGFPRVIGGTVDIGAVESGSADFDPAGLTLTTQGASNLTLLEISTDPNFLNTVGTFAGTGETVFANGPRDTATFNHPSGVAEDDAGNLYVADTGNHRIRKIDKSTGEVTTIAGTGAFGFADGNGLTTAKFAFPAAVAVTADGGVVYVSDTINHRIRKLTKPAVIGQPWTVTTLAGTGVAGLTEGSGSIARFNHPHGLVLNANGDLLVADTSNNRIRKVTAAGVTSTYVSGIIVSPMGLDFDSLGNLFVAEQDTHLIRKVAAPPSLAISTFAGTSQGFQDSPARFRQPVALAIDGDDNLYVSDQNNHAIRKITSTGVVTTVAPVGVAPTPNAAFVDGNSSAARFNGPSGLLVDSDGFLIVTDTKNNRLRRLSIEPLTVATSHNAGTGTLTADIDAILLGLTPGQTYYFRWLPQGGGTPVAGTSFQVLLPPTVVTDPASQLTSTGGQLNATVNPQGSNTAVIFEYSTDPQLRGPWQVSSLPPGSLTDPQGVAAFDGITYVADQAANAIYTVDALGVATLFAGAANGDPGFADGTYTAARFDSPAGLAVDAAGNLFVADRLNHCIRKITPGGVVSTLAGSGLAGFADGEDDVARFLFPQGVAVSGNNVYVADTDNHRIRRIDKTTGAVTTLAGNGTAAFADGAGTSARFSSPRAVAVNAAGQLHVADTGNHAIRLLTAGNSVVTLAGNGTAGFLDGAGTSARFNSPAGLAIDPDGTIYVTDQANHRVRSISSGGVVGTVAGSGVAGLLDSPVGLLHPATVAKLDSPGGIALDASGKIIITEETSNRIRHIARASLPTLVANPNMITAGPASAVISDELLPGATYYFRAVATNGRGEVEGEILSFTTPQSNIVVHNGPTDAAPVIVPGQVVDFGTTPFNTPVVRTFTIKNIGNFTLSVTGVSLTGSPAGVFSLSGQTGTFAIAAGATGTFQVTLNHGSPGTFTKTVSVTSNDLDQPAIEFDVTGTVLAPPLLTNVAASDVTALGVTFAATVNPQGSATEVLFEYSKDPDFAGALEVLTKSGSTQGFSNGCGGAAQFSNPSGVAVDRFGNIYVADTGNHCIRRIAANGDCTVFAGSGNAGSANGLGILASLNAPEGVAVDAAGNVYVADTGNHWIRKITPAGAVTTLAGFGTTGSFTDGIISGARFNAPAGIAIDATGNLFIADTGNNRIRKISPAGEVSTFAGPGGYNAPKGVAVDGDGWVHVADTGNNRIVKFTATAPQITTGFNGPTGVAVDAAGFIYVADRSVHRIARIDLLGVVTNLAGTSGVSGDNDGSGTTAKFNLPTGIAVSPSGTIFVADSLNHRIRQINLAARRVVAATNLVTTPEAPVMLTLVGLEPNTTYYYRGIASNGGGTVYSPATTPLTFTTLDNDAELAELSLNGTPVPNFDPCAYSYPYTPETQQSSLVFFAESSSPDAYMQLFQNGEFYSELESGVSSDPVPLVEGLNTFQIIVVSADGTNFRTYAVETSFDPPESGFAQWQALKFGANASDPLIAGPLADPDKDGSVNLLEYAFDLDPNLSSAVGLPFLGKSGGFLTLTYRKRVGASDLTYLVQWSTDLIEWFETGIIEEPASPQGAGLTEEIRAKIPDTGPRKFLRVSVRLD